MGANPAVYRGSAAYPSPSPGPVVTIGNFDGVHLGHQALLEVVIQRARADRRPSCVYTFDPAPRDVLRPDNGIPRIQTLDEKIASLGAVGVDQVVVEAFTRDFGSHGARWFADEILRRRLGASALVVGWDFRFGRGREGDVTFLREALDVPVEAFGPWTLEGEVVSSSRIRQATRDGRVEEAARMLGRPHRVLGRVVQGDRRGRTLGFPTANLRPSTELLPADGVYAVRLHAGDQSWPGVANIGIRPTFGPGARAVEVHLLGFEGDLYGQEVAVDMVARIRDEHAFPSREALIARIRQDVDAARALLEP